jgi:hypothetical protein
MDQIKLVLNGLFSCGDVEPLGSTTRELLQHQRSSLDAFVKVMLEMEDVEIKTKKAKQSPGFLIRIIAKTKRNRRGPDESKQKEKS